MAKCLSHNFVLSFLSKDFSFATTNKVSPCNLAPSASPIKKKKRETANQIQLRGSLGIIKNWNTAGPAIPHRVENTLS